MSPEEMSLEEINWTVLNQKPGKKYIYHVGLLTGDRGFSKRTPRQKRVNAIAESMYQFHKNGYVHLVQRKITGGVYEYIAVRREVNPNGGK